MFRFPRRTLAAACLPALLAACASVDPGTERDLAYHHYLKGREAYRAERHDEALGHFQKALKHNPHEVAALEKVGQIHYLREEFEAAAAAFSRALEISGSDSDYLRGWLAYCHLAMHRYIEVVEQCSRIIERNPRNLSAWLKRVAALRALGDVERGRHACQWGLQHFPGARELRRQLAWFLAREGQLVQSLAEFRKAEEPHGWLAGDEDVLRLVLVKLGQYRQALAAWRNKGTAWAVEVEGNRLRERFARLDPSVAAFERAPNRLSFGVELARAFERVGWIEEAEAVWRRCLAIAPGAALPRQEIARLGALRRLLEDLRSWIYRSYGEHRRRGGGPTVEEVLARIEAGGREAGLPRIDPRREISELGLVYRFVDPGEHARGELGRFFRDRGMLFMLMDFFGPVEANLKNLLHWNPGATRRLWDKPLHYEALICERTHILHYREYLAHSSFGGLTLSPRTFWLDVETYTRIAHQIAAGFRRAQGEERELFAEEEAPLAPTEIAGASRLRDRLAYAVAREAQDQLPPGGSLVGELARRLLESAEYHELGHIQLQREYLPVSAHLVRGLGLLIQEGFSADNISTWSERQAQLTALAHASWPAVPLYRTVSSIGRSPEHSRHARAYREILADYARYIHGRPERYPNIDPRRNILAQLHRLTGDQVREIARALY